MITAQQARKLADAKKASYSEDLYKEICTSIKIAASNGYSQIYVHPINEEVQSWLTLDSFILEDHPTQTKISW